jgi:hypothetical protein
VFENTSNDIFALSLTVVDAKLGRRGSVSSSESFALTLKNFMISQDGQAEFTQFLSTALSKGLIVPTEPEINLLGLWQI